MEFLKQEGPAPLQLSQFHAYHFLESGGTIDITGAILNKRMIILPIESWVWDGDMMTDKNMRLNGQLTKVRDNSGKYVYNEAAWTKDTDKTFFYLKADCRLTANK